MKKNSDFIIRNYVYLINIVVGHGFGLALLRTSSTLASRIALISLIGFNIQTGTSSSLR